ncbi:DUF1796 family putative cysteine peptidase [Cytobacillus purgationiresistens]|uniref:Peptidase n=1 Tax=Cytobacillus purgationiresistens TaxID=863449 RepID=A0ABU0AEQ1_9BACI|nr:DUF1796 family putative cysteine peptidase [Cytobacillus purgationiresistens]MDQ0269728.1 hypothetical protein [Cytobacillus purgationiresistens]
MSLKDIQGEYNTVFSLGNLCLSAIQMKNNQIRPFSGVFDWIGTPKTDTVTTLIKSRFANFLNFNNLVPEKYLSERDLYVWDKFYDIGFNHDFYTDKNSLTHLGGFPEVKAKYNRRIKRFLDSFETSERILFIRTEAEYGDVKELQATLNSMVKNKFELLIVNHKNIPTMIEKTWDIKHVTVVEMPDHEIWEGNDALWKQLLKDVKLKK